jgi:enoyl-CoA hydratase/carnithine racemase
MSPDTVGLVPVPYLTLSEYAEKYRDTFLFERRAGILQMAFHTRGGPAGGDGVHGAAGSSYDAWNRAWRDVGSDPENAVLILTGTGDRWLKPPSNGGISSPAGHTPSGRRTGQTYLDAVKNTENFLFSFDIPTIGAINGPAPFHFATGLLCDLTLCSDDAVFQESHCALGTAPGDGLAFVLQELIGVKRAAYYLYRSAPITAAEALDLGLVNEVLPRDRLLPRAWEIAEEIAAMPPLGKLMAKQIIRRRWLKVHADEAAFQMAHEMLGAVIEVPEGTAMTGQHWGQVEQNFEQAVRDAAPAHD